jgi:uncharacterized protein (TIGR01777 family)
MKTIALNGSHGFLGQQICKYFDNKYNILRINRKDYLIDPALLAEKLSGADIILNMAGEQISIFSSREKRERIYNSRIQTTRNLVSAIRLMNRKPKHVISMSAIGIYDYQNIHDETSVNFGNDFLANVCKDWEHEVHQMQGVPYTVIRCGIVLSKHEGILKKMVVPCKFGFGAVLGDGSQHISFIHIHDFLRAFEFVIDHHLTGIINFVAQKFCTNLELSKILSRTMKRPLFFKIPAGLIRLVTRKQSFMLLEGQRVIPKVLFDNGFTFMHSGINSAIKNIIRFT